MESEGSGVFPLRDTIKEAWRKVRGAKSAYFQAVLVYLALLLVLSGLRLLNGRFAEQSQYTFIQLSAFLLGLLIMGCEFVLNLVFTPGLLLLGIRRAADMELCFKRIFDPLRCVWPFVLAVIAQALIIGAVVLLFVPLYFLGFTPAMVVAAVILICLLIYINVAMVFVFSLIMAGGYGTLQSIRLSVSGVTRHLFKILALLIVSAFAVMLGAAAFGIGLIWAVPFVCNIHGIAFRNIFGLNPQRLQAIELWR